MLLGLSLIGNGPYHRAKIVNLSLEVSDQWCVCYTVEASSSPTTSKVNASSSKTSSAASLFSVAFILFYCSVISTGYCRVTVIPVIDSHGRWGCFCFWNNFFLPSFLNNVEITLLSLFKVDKKDAICRDLKNQENLQELLSIQNLNSPKCSSPHHPYQTSEMKLRGNLQEVDPELQGIQLLPN